MITVDLHVLFEIPTIHSVVFFNDTATTEIYTLSLHDALPISHTLTHTHTHTHTERECKPLIIAGRSEEHTSELQSHLNLVCRLLLEKHQDSRTRWISRHGVLRRCQTCAVRRSL